MEFDLPQRPNIVYIRSVSVVNGGFEWLIMVGMYSLLHKVGTDSTLANETRLIAECYVGNGKRKRNSECVDRTSLAGVIGFKIVIPVSVNVYILLCCLSGRFVINERKRIPDTSNQYKR